MYCKACGEAMNDNQAICLNCGVKTGQGNAFCSNCGNSVNPEAEVCLSCGVATKRSKLGSLDFGTSHSGNGDLGNYNKVTMALIAFFVGGLGIHNFMLGETKKGLVKIGATLLTYGLAGEVLAIIDFVKILTDKYEINPDKFI
ncbi:TM2 domain-containing protein [Streptococcus loxodontisalivarius]|uniref:OB-fold protein n=1 Tax=Streptococcus loxodontisalivarius TaxID=1349415 RepID=A0ABS2PR11_9STRE|nr:TM2 domain-containing protein [Streptococcus loxodontisalivarius]MBM7642482.1 putative OB-fold protein [Streptococcus loxodontisalivarius]